MINPGAQGKDRCDTKQDQSDASWATLRPLVGFSGQGERKKGSPGKQQLANRRSSFVSNMTQQLGLNGLLLPAVSMLRAASKLLTSTWED